MFKIISQKIFISKSINRPFHTIGLLISQKPFIRCLWPRKNNRLARKKKAKPICAAHLIDTQPAAESRKNAALSYIKISRKKTDSTFNTEKNRGIQWTMRRSAHKPAR